MDSHELEYIGKRKWYKISVKTMSQFLCLVALCTLGINYLLYSFFQLDFNRNILRYIAGSFFLLSIFLGRKIGVRELCLILVAMYMLIVNGSMSSNITYILLASIAIPYNANFIWKQLNRFQIALAAIVILCIVLKSVNYNITTYGGRVRNNLGFTNVNAAALFFFSLSIIWLLQLRKVSVQHLLITVAFSYVIYRFTDSRTVFACTLVFAICFLVLNRWNGTKMNVLICIVISLFYLSPFLVIVLKSIFPQLDLLLSYRLTKFADYLNNNTIKNLLFGGTKSGDVDSFYLCLLYNGGLFFYVFTWIMNLISVNVYVKNSDYGYVAFIFSVCAYGLMESGVVRCELLCMVLFWHLLLRHLKSEGKRNYV